LSHYPVNREIHSSETFESQRLAWITDIASFWDLCVFFADCAVSCCGFPWVPEGFRRHGVSLEIPPRRAPLRETFSEEEK